MGSILAIALLMSLLCASSGLPREYADEFRIFKFDDTQTTCSVASQDPDTMTVSHAYGSCSTLNADRAVDPVELLILDRQRVDRIHRRMSNPGLLTDGWLTRDAEDVSVVSGQNLSAAGVFLMTVHLGTPPRKQTVFLDTGSDLCWVQCTPCTDFCYVQKEPYFNPTRSSTYRHVNCSDPYCSYPEFSKCNPVNYCVYGAFYSGGGSTGGFLSRDTLTLMPGETVPNFVFGCSENFQGNFGRAAGVFGLGRKRLSLISQASAKYGSMFSYCLPYSGQGTGYVKFGPAAMNSSKAPAFYTPMLTYPGDSTFYGISLTGIGVNGRRLPVATSVFTTAGTILDSGTTVTYLPPDAYAPFRTAVRKAMKDLGYGEPMAMNSLDTCYNVTGVKNLRIPSVQLFFSGGSLSLRAGNIVMSVGRSIACLAFAGNRASSDMTIIGNTQQKGYGISLDLGSERIGFAGRAC